MGGIARWLGGQARLELPTYFRKSRRASHVDSRFPSRIRNDAAARLVPGRHTAITAMLSDSKGNLQRRGRSITLTSALSPAAGQSEIAI